MVLQPLQTRLPIAIVLNGAFTYDAVPERVVEVADDEFLAVQSANRSDSCSVVMSESLAQHDGMLEVRGAQVTAERKPAGLLHQLHLIDQKQAREGCGVGCLYVAGQPAIDAAAGGCARAVAHRQLHGRFQQAVRSGYQPGTVYIDGTFEP